MALATIKLIPNREQLDVFGYSRDDAETWDWLSQTFTGEPVLCNLDFVNHGGMCDPKDVALGVWIDGICVPYEWCNVTDLTEEEAQIVKDFAESKRNG